MRIPLANEPIIDASGKALSGLNVNVYQPNTITQATVYANETGGATLAQPLVCALGAAPGWVEEGAYDFVVSGSGLTSPITRRVMMIDASGTAQIRANAIVSGMIQDGQVTLQDLAAGLLPTTFPDDAYPNILHDGITAESVGALTWNNAASVSIAAGAVWVTSSSGLLVRKVIPATTLSGIPVAVNVRLDTVVYDSNDGTIKRLVGADQAGVTLDNRTGAANIGAGQLWLWDLLVTSAGVNTAEGTGYRDCRRGATGIRVKTLRTAPGAAITNTLGGLVKNDYKVTCALLTGTLFATNHVLWFNGGIGCANSVEVMNASGGVVGSSASAAATGLVAGYASAASSSSFSIIDIMTLAGVTYAHSKLFEVTGPRVSVNGAPLTNSGPLKSIGIQSPSLAGGTLVVEEGAR